MYLQHHSRVAVQLLFSKFVDNICIYLSKQVITNYINRCNKRGRTNKIKYNNNNNNSKTEDHDTAILHILNWIIFNFYNAK